MTLLFAFLIGLFAGLRSLTAPAATAWAVRLGWLKLEGLLALMGSLPAVVMFTLLAIVELVADKLPKTPNRTSPPGPDRAHSKWRHNGRVRCRWRRAGNPSRRFAGRRWRCCGVFRRLSGARAAREGAGRARHLRCPARGSGGDSRQPVGRFEILKGPPRKQVHFWRREPVQRSNTLCILLGRNYLFLSAKILGVSSCL